MKKIRIVLAVFMLTLVGMAWVSQISKAVQNNNFYRKEMEEAQSLLDVGLYQKAIASLENALSIREAEDVRCKWRDAYSLAFEDGVATKKQYINAMEQVADLQPDNVDNWEKLLAFCLEAEDYKSAHAYLKKAEEIGVTSEKLKEYQRQIRYSYTIKGRVFVQVLRSPSGYCAVTNGDKWGILDQSGEWKLECTYAFLGPVTDSMVKLMGDGEEYRIVDNKGIVQSIFREPVEEAKAIADSIVPVLYGGRWKYYDSTRSEYILGSYEDVTSFADGIAAVKENGSWKLVDRNGEQVGNTVFEDIKQYSSGEYLYKGFFVAKSGGKYGLYNQKAEVEAEISCNDMDVYFGGDIAYQDQNGKWGFMDRKGNVDIEPKYDEAKSFSNGLAAVRVGEEWGFIDSSGELAIECQFLNAGYFTSGGVCFVSKLEGEYFMIALRFHE